MRGTILTILIFSQKTTTSLMVVLVAISQAAVISQAVAISQAAAIGQAAAISQVVQAISLIVAISQAVVPNDFLPNQK